MGGDRRRWLGALLFLVGCGTPFHCEHSSSHDLGGNPPSYDFAVGELGRPPGNACTTLDQCNRTTADRCSATCRCGDDGPCTSGACCDGRCVDLRNDPLNCGGCGIQCPTGECVGGDGGAPHCTCDVDGGGDCSSALEPSCNADGLCTCGPSSAGVCGPQFADSCGATGCSCNGSPACTGGLTDHCEPGRGCRCGAEPACDNKLATGCDPTKRDSACRCASGPGCAAGTFCCTQNSTCCGPSQYCCLDGCCDQPCLFFGFCGR